MNTNRCAGPVNHPAPEVSPTSHALAALFQVRLWQSPHALLTENLVVLTQELLDLDKSLKALSHRIQTILRVPSEDH